ncbi:tRNA (adenosine(37)-N6)-dimethylallyltransferase MiaA [Oleomonas cavernae]|uniref:tRNA dimethylallyltransferase n=1 Tax=Oleomonas cavernae TaxID=2320859 RepID=A0A418W9G7_9PROT|nr:tRNA (adenosine(37)-N6)-dimethylallyltransferase MiaA [Oleomonas cavernae]RJF86638.1 tRNA (adenosine(37)-N6)-dimethylallyltransferase MiaA [Oleomonas cavernae]
MGVTVLIAGPTASGKSGIALDLAERLGGTVINADSMQVYSGLHIITARPDAAAQARARHRLYGVLPPDDPCSAARWAMLAQGEIKAAHAAGQVAIVVGGTGLYFHALTDGLADIPQIPPKIRGDLMAWLARDGAPALHAELARLDPDLAARLEPGDGQRILRGLEVIQGTGRPLSAWQADPTTAPPADLGTVVRLVVAPERATLLPRIRSRLEIMARTGAVEEAQAFMALDLDPTLPASKAIGLKAFAALGSGQIDLATALERAEIETRQYAKRQMTWVRGRMGDWPPWGAQETVRIFAELEQKMRQ